MSAFKTVLCNKFLVTLLQFTDVLHQDKMSHVTIRLPLLKIILFQYTDMSVVLSGEKLVF